MLLLLLGWQGLLSLFGAVLTFNTGMKLAGLRRSNLFTKKMRETIADFAPTIGKVALQLHFSTRSGDLDLSLASTAPAHSVCSLGAQVSSRGAS